MPEVVLLALALVLAGVVVLAPLRRTPVPPTQPADEGERRAAELRHRVALEALRDVETDRRAGSLDDDAYTHALAEAETRAAATRAALEDTSGAGSSAATPPRRVPPAVPFAVAGAIGLALVAGSLLPVAGIANQTVVDEALAEAEAAEEARRHRIEELTEALREDPSNPRVLSDLADAYLAGTSREDLVAAATALQLLIALEPDRADAYERIVTAYIRGGDYGNARAAWTSYDGIESADPVEVAFLDGLIALRGENDPNRARSAFDRFLELAPDDPRATMVDSLRQDVAAGD